VHLQLGSRADGRRLARPLPRWVFVSALALMPSCTSAPASTVHADWTVDTTNPVVGAPIVVQLRLVEEGRAVTGARLDVNGQMSHPGMAPVPATVDEEANGVYRVRMQVPMAGDWSVTVTGALPDGRVLNERFSIANVRPSG